MPKKKSNSNILKCIVSCLEEERFPHVLYWENRSEMKFTMLFVHKNNPKWSKAYLDLFMALDSLSPKRKYFERPEYIKECKVRCKSNLKKLCDEGTLVKGDKRNYDKSMFSITYQIKDPNGTYRQLMTGCEINTDKFRSPCKDSGNSSFMDYNEITNCTWNIIFLAPTSETPLRLESSDNSIHGDESNLYGGCKNLSEHLIMGTDSGIHYPDKTSTPVGELADISLYASNENCYGEPREYLSNPNTAKGSNEDKEMEILYPEESYYINVTKKENVEWVKTEISLKNDDDEIDENGFNYKLDEIQPTIGLLDESTNPFMGCYELPIFQ